ncbi:calcium-binding protein, partial [Veronia pacifica]
AGTAENDYLESFAGNDTVNGNEGNDTIMGGRGDDTLNGGVGDDVYIFRKGDGHDTITDEHAGVRTVQYQAQESYQVRVPYTRYRNVTVPSFKGTTTRREAYTDYRWENRYRTVTRTREENFDDFAGNDVLKLQGGITAADILLRTESNSLIVDLGDGDKVTINRMENSKSAIERIELDDGTSVDLSSMTSAMASGTMGDSNKEGGSGHDLLFGTDTADVLNGGAGNDILYGNGGADALNGGAGNDTLHADSSDSVSGGEGIDTVVYHSDDAVDITLADDIENVRGSSQGDKFTGNASDNVIEGMGGDDTLSGGAGNDTLIGGQGDDILAGGEGSDTYRYGSGQGDDTIVNKGDASTTDTLELGDGISKYDVVFRRDGDHLQMRIDDDTVTLEDWYTQPSEERLDEIKTSSGDTLLMDQIDQLVQTMASFSQSGVSDGGSSTESLPQEVIVAVDAAWRG